MKNTTAYVLGMLAIGAGPAIAESGVYKCTGASAAIVYQDVPCKEVHSQVTLVEPRKREPLTVDAQAASPDAQLKPVSEGEQRSVLSSEELIPGISDTKVLNMRGWGRPQNIARSRGADGWREEWTYVSRSDGAQRLVTFVNGRVSGVTSQDALQVARARQETQQLADQTRRSIESMTTASARDDSQRPERAVTAQYSSAALAKSDNAARSSRWVEIRPARDGVESAQSVASVSVAESSDMQRRAEVDPASRAAAAIARIEQSRREPLPAMPAEPPSRGWEPARPPLEALVQSSDRGFVGADATVTQ